MKNKNIKLLFGLLFLVPTVAFCSTLFPFQGGTGIGTATTTDVGKVLTVASSSPFLTYNFSTVLSNVSIAGLVDNIFKIVGGTGISISTSTSPSTITITNTGLTGVIADSPLSGSGTSASHLIFTNPGYLTSASGVTTFNGSSGAVTGVGSLSSTNGLVTLNNSTGTITLTASTTPTFSNIADSGIAANSLVATDANHNFIATTTPSSGAKNLPINYTINNPAASENDSIAIINTTSTISKVIVTNKRGGDSVTFNMGYSKDRGTATSSLNNLFSSPKTITIATSSADLLVGTSTIPTSNNDVGANYVYYNKWTAPTTGVMTNIYFYLNAANVGNIAFALYSDNSGAPGTLLAYTTSTSANTTGWINTSLVSPTSYSIISGTTYWLAHNQNFSSSNNMEKYGAGITNQFTSQNVGTYTFPATATPGSYFDQFYPIYGVGTYIPIIPFCFTTVATTSSCSSGLIDGSSTPGQNNPLILWTTAASSTQFTVSTYYSEN